MDSSTSTARPKKSLRCFTLSSTLLIVTLCFMSVYHGSRSLSFCIPSTSIATKIEQHEIAATSSSVTQSYSIEAVSTLSEELTTGGMTPSYELATMESYGFFDDIDDITWKRHQQRARTESLYAKPSNPNANSKNPPLWLLFNVDPLFTCPNLRRVGGRGDGPKWTCDPHRLVQKPDCLIYSIGSRGIYRFEDGIVDTLKQNDPTANTIQEGEAWLPNCEIHVFDPNPAYGRVGDIEKKNIHYHAIGLKSSYEPFDFGNFPKTYEFLSFQGIQKRLGHQHRRIDVFKIDCEGCEWSTYKDWLQPDVDIRQVLIETHKWGEEQLPNVFFDRFLDLGLVPYSKEANTHPAVEMTGQLFEWGFVKLHPNFLRRSTNIMNVKFE